MATVIELAVESETPFSPNGVFTLGHPVHVA